MASEIEQIGFPIVSNINCTSMKPFRLGGISFSVCILKYQVHTRGAKAVRVIAFFHVQKNNPREKWFRTLHETGNFHRLVQA